MTLQAVYVDDTDILFYHYGVGYSAVELDNDIVLGRPFGGILVYYIENVWHSV